MASGIKISNKAVRTLLVSAVIKSKKLDVPIGKAAKVRLERSREVANLHFNNAVAQVGELLSDGPSSIIGTSGGKAVLFTHADGARGRVVTAPWAALSDKYAKSAPKSSVFWRKTGALAGYYQSAGNRALGKVRLSKVKTSKLRKGSAIRATASLDFPTMPAPLNRVLSNSFVAGKEKESVYLSIKKGGRNSLKRLVFPDKARPFIGKMSALLGRRMKTAIRKSE